MTDSQHLSSVPHLTTALTGPLLKLESEFLAQQSKIESWFRAQWRKTPAPFYASVDLRNAGYKLAPVDTNLFPAGFNNLNTDFGPLCIQSIQSVMERDYPDAVRVLLIAENHTRNLYYLENIASIQSFLEQAGFETRVGWLTHEVEEVTTVQLPSQREVTLYRLQRTVNKIHVDHFDPCVILLNNDLSSGRPELLENIKQPIIPPLEVGWSQRRKSDHCGHYEAVSAEFSKMLDVDPWLVSPLFQRCGKINFMTREGETCLADNVALLLGLIQKKYTTMGIEQKPFVFIKADSGTYGMGVLAVSSPEDIFRLNRKKRSKLSAAKGGQSVSEVILQEGVHTVETWGDNNATAEPVVYMVDHHVVGGFYRVHQKRSTVENLNAPGMQFEPLAFAESCITPNKELSPNASPNRFYAYGVIARLALLAAAREIDEVR
jgi:glutamate--cysteine ligase